jgi:Fe-coproporphyrin III synthase
LVGISKLYCGSIEVSDALRYGRQSSKLPSHLLQFSEDKKPVVILNITKRCNLGCVHCYSGSDGMTAENELTTSQWFKVLDDLAAFGSPVALFSGGEPLLHKDITKLAKHAVSLGMRAVISTNGTLLTGGKADELASVGLSYVGISLDGTGVTHDSFRGVNGAFDSAIRGLKTARNSGIKTGVRFTITKRNVEQIPGIFELVEKEEIPRVCFYHLVYSGRGSSIVKEALSLEKSRETVDKIIDLTEGMHSRGKPVEVLTVDNHCDGPYLYLRLLKENNTKRAEEVLELLKLNGGNSTGLGISCVSWDGAVHPDQFWRNHILGNVLEKPFGAIWTDSSNDFLMKLKEKKKHLKGRCSKCRFLEICGGNFRARAEAVTGDIWEPDPACYLTDEEIGIEHLQ